MQKEFKGRIIFSDNYQSTIDNIKLVQKSFGENARIIKSLIESDIESKNSEIKVISGYSEKSKIAFDALKKIKIKNLSAYDESILELNSLEGKVRCIVHCLVIQDELEYIPAAYVTLKFYTKSSIINSSSNEFSDIIRTNNMPRDINKEYTEERKYFLSLASPKNTLIFIDGPMFSGAATAGNFLLIDQLLKEDTRPVFFVKNSESTIITESFSYAKGYNSDLHWAYSTLKTVEYTPVYSYKSEGRGKAMCFMKIFKDRSPIRIEFPLNAFLDGYYGDDVFDSIYYQFLANGSESNVQPRIIQVAEMYAREILKSTNLYKEIERLGLTKNMNETRGF